jgi:PAS domain S-box-containing protein
VADPTAAAEENQALQARIAELERRLAGATENPPWWSMLPVLQSIGDIVMVVDSAHRVLFLNSAAVALLEQAPEELHGQDVETLFSISSEQATARPWLHGEWAGEWPVRRSDGTIRLLEGATREVTDIAGVARGMVGVFRDVTERRQVVEALHTSEERFHIFMEYNPASAWICDVDGTLLYANTAFRRVLAPPAEDPVGKSIFEIFPPDLARTYHENNRIVAATGELMETIEESLRADGSSGAYLVHKFRIPSPDGSPMIGGVGLEITDRQMLDQALRESEGRYRLLFERSHDAIIIGDDSGAYIDANEAAAELIGVPRERLIGMNVAELRPVTRENAGELYAKYLETGFEQGEFSFYRPDGEFRVALYTASRIGEGMHLSILQDITERKVAEQALRDSEERYRLITENASDIIELFDVDTGGVCVYASPSHRKVFGAPPEAIVGLQILDAIHYADYDIVREIWETAAAGGEASGAARVRHADGGWRWIEATLKATQQRGRRYVLLVGRDVTERKQIEQRYLQAQKMDSIGRLAGGVAHDFNNLLTAMQGYTTFALDSIEPEHPARIDLIDVQHAIERAGRLTQQLLAFARRQPTAPQSLNLNDLIVDMMKLLRRLIGEDIELIVLPDPQLAYTRADPGQIEQVLVNLVVNARDAMPGGGKLIIETSNVTFDAEYVRQHVTVTPGRYVMLAITDTGTGIAPDVMAHLFEPFFTTKEAGRGTGLGLATSYGIIAQHGGYIWCYSELDEGTTFKVYLPQHADPPVVPDRPPVVTDIPRGSETLLVVEDEPAVRDLMQRILRAHGYTVLAAANGVEALMIYEAHTATPIMLVITDIIMPQLGGIELAARLRGIDPQIQVLFTSGYTDQAVIAHGHVDTGAPFLQKPFSAPELARTVRAILDGTT